MPLGTIRDTSGGSVQLIRLAVSTATNRVMGVGGTGTNFATTFTSEVVRVVANIACCIRFGAPGEVTAATTDMFIPANSPEYFPIVAGQTMHHIGATVTATGVAGNLWYQEAI